MHPPQFVDTLHPYRVHRHGKRGKRGKRGTSAVPISIAISSKNHQVPFPPLFPQRDWFSWEHRTRKPSIFPWNIGPSHGFPVKNPVKTNPLIHSSLIEILLASDLWDGVGPLRVASQPARPPSPIHRAGSGRLSGHDMWWWCISCDYDMFWHVVRYIETRDCNMDRKIRVIMISHDMLWLGTWPCSFSAFPISLPHWCRFSLSNAEVMQKNSLQWLELFLHFADVSNPLKPFPAWGLGRFREHQGMVIQVIQLEVTSQTVSRV